jgi:hypothetical protein
MVGGRRSNCGRCVRPPASCIARRLLADPEAPGFAAAWVSPHRRRLTGCVKVCLLTRTPLLSVETAAVCVKLSDGDSAPLLAGAGPERRRGCRFTRCIAGPSGGPKAALFCWGTFGAPFGLMSSGIAPRIGGFRRIQWRFLCLDGCLASRLRH